MGDGGWSWTGWSLKIAGANGVVPSAVEDSYLPAWARGVLATTLILIDDSGYVPVVECDAVEKGFWYQTVDRSLWEADEEVVRAL